MRREEILKLIHYSELMDTKFYKLSILNYDYQMCEFLFFTSTVGTFKIYWMVN